LKNSLKKLPSTNEIEKELCKRSFHEFVTHAFPIVEPNTEYQDNWHIEAICMYLEAILKGDIRNLIINIPPRHMKSLLVNVLFPAWVWTFAPEKKFLFASYAQDLANRDSQLCRTLITSPWYQSKWQVTLKNDENRKDRFANTTGGHRISVGVGGAATGEGGDFIIVDDPIKAQDASSDLIRTTANLWWDNTMSTRGNNPKTVAKIVIMQRLHEDDLTGHLLEGEEKYEHLCLPAEYDGIRFVSSIGFVDPRKKEGELLWEGRFGRKEIDSLKNQLSESGVAGQLQQRPSPKEGFIFQKDWFSNRTQETDFVARYISWDTAGSDAEGSAYSSCVVGELTPDYRLFIREVYRGRLNFPDLENKVIEIATRYKYGLKQVVIENKSSGQALVQSLVQTAEPWLSEIIFPFQPKTGKENRADAASLWCEKGMVTLPPPSDENSWLFDFEAELFSFPNSKYKDQVDAFDQLVNFLQYMLAEGYRSKQNN
jgi:predicted phage terminase large subunit-like protein